MKPMAEKHLAILRRHMVEVILIHADLLEEELGKAAFDQRVLTVMLHIPRQLFVPGPLAHLAYDDMPLPIGFEKTISQPFMCALRTDLLGLEAHETVLEVGNGLGYQTAILAELARQVWSVEIIEEFPNSAQQLLGQVGYTNVGIRIGEGSRGWPEQYDRGIYRQPHESKQGEIAVK